MVQLNLSTGAAKGLRDIMGFALKVNAEHFPNLAAEYSEDGEPENLTAWIEWWHDFMEQVK